MGPYLGDYLVGKDVHLMFDTNDANGASVSPTITAGDIKVYKDNNIGSEIPVTASEFTKDFDFLTGIHRITLDVSLNTLFYTAGSDFIIVLSTSTIDGQTVRSVLATFSIENRLTKTDVADSLADTSIKDKLINITDGSFLDFLCPRIADGFDEATGITSQYYKAQSTNSSFNNGMRYAVIFTKLEDGTGILPTYDGNQFLGSFLINKQSSAVYGAWQICGGYKVTNTGVIVSNSKFGVCSRMDDADYIKDISNGGFWDGETDLTDETNRTEGGWTFLCKPVRDDIGETALPGSYDDLEIRSFINFASLDVNMVGINHSRTNDHLAELKMKQLSVESSAAGQPAIRAIGGGSWAGIYAEGGETGDGIKAKGGAVSGHGVHALGGASSSHGIKAIGGAINGTGFWAEGDGSGSGINAIAAGETGNGISATGGIDSGAGISALGSVAGGHGIHAIGQDDLSGDWNGIRAEASSGAGSGLKAIGIGSGAGLHAEGGVTAGHGAYFNGGASGGAGIYARGPADYGIYAYGSGAGLRAEATNGPGLRAIGSSGYAGVHALGAGVGHGLHAEGGSTGYGIYGKGGGGGADGIVGEGNGLTSGYHGIRGIAYGTGRDLYAKEIGIPADLGEGGTPSLAKMLTSMADGGDGDFNDLSDTLHDISSSVGDIANLTGSDRVDTIYYDPNDGTVQFELEYVDPVTNKGRTGLAVKMYIQRTSDSKYWDGAFWQNTAQELSMTEKDSINFPGSYYYTLDLTTAGADDDPRKAWFLFGRMYITAGSYAFDKYVFSVPEKSEGYLRSIEEGPNYLEKSGSVWYLRAKQPGTSTIILNKMLKDKDGNNISDPDTGAPTEAQDDASRP